MSEECLLLLILLVTEMPVVPDPLGRKPSNNGSGGTGVEEQKWGDGVGGGGGGGSSGGSGDSRSLEAAGKPGGAMDRRLARQLRRELVHRLAWAPCTHSELQDTCYATSHNETLEAEVSVAARLVCLLCLVCALFLCGRAKGVAGVRGFSAWLC